MNEGRFDAAKLMHRTDTHCARKINKLFKNQIICSDLSKLRKSAQHLIDCIECDDTVQSGCAETDTFSND